MKFKHSKLVALLSSMLSIAAPAAADITINELMPCNLGTYMDDLYNYPGWVELYNSSTSAVDLNGYTFSFINSDGEESSSTISYTCSVPAGGYLVLCFDEVENTNNHFPFKLDADGGELTLTNKSGSKVASVSMPEMTAYISYGLYDGEYGYMLPTPKAANSEINGTLSTRCTAPTFGTAPGLHELETSVSTTITSTTTGAKIYYTTNGSVPSPTNGKLYSGEITLSKSCVVRARAYADGKLPSKIVSGSYIFKDSQHTYCGGFTVPIVSISTDSANFYDKTIGICVTGTNGVEGDKSCISEKANFNRDWKRPVNMEFILGGSQVFSQEAEVAVMGGCSRKADNKVKSLKVSTNKKCGSGLNKMKYAFFDDKDISKYKSLHIRNGGNAYDGIRFRDGYMQALIHGLNIDYQAYRPVAYYINGVYQGFMELRERINDDYLWSNYGLDTEDIDMVKLVNDGVEVENGDIEAYEALEAAVSEDPTSDGYYDKVSLLLDMDEYMNYEIFEQFVVNTDWPSNNNKMWRNKKNGRFRHIVYDSDFGFGLYGGDYPNYSSYTTDMIKFCKGEGSVLNWGNANESGDGYAITSDSKWKILIFSQLMKNEQFRQKYLAKWMLQLNTIYTYDNMKAVWDSIAGEAETEFCASNGGNNQWWHYTYDGETSGNVKAILEFMEKRPSYALSYVAEEFDGSVVTLKINSDNENAKFVLNNEYINSSSYSGNYISNNSISIRPVAPAGYKFSYWDLSSSLSKALLTSSSTWQYYYEGKLPSSKWTSLDYDDADWSTGSGSFGYGTTRTYDVGLDYGDDSDNKYVTSYFRSYFTLDDAKQFAKLSGSITYDDGVVIYVNGKEVTRLNMNEGDVADSTLAITYVNDDTKNFEIADSFLVEGNNVIAVEVHQNSVSSSDMTFELTLNGVGHSTSSTSKVALFEGVVSDNFEITAHFEKCDAEIPLVINEICSSNKSDGGYADEFGRYGDWIEIYNNGDQDYDLAGMYITNNAKADKRQKFQFPYTDPSATIVAPGEHKIIWADEETWQGPLHLNFALAVDEAKPVILSYMDASGNLVVVDSMTYKKDLAANSTYGRETDAASSWVVFTDSIDVDGIYYLPTPADVNGSKTVLKAGVDDVLAGNDIKISVYPNPANDVINVMTSISGDVNMEIVDVLGRVVLSSRLSDNAQQINISNLAGGVYTIRLFNSADSATIKFIKY